MLAEVGFVGVFAALNALRSMLMAVLPRSFKKPDIQLLQGVVPA